MSILDALNVLTQWKDSGGHWWYYGFLVFLGIACIALVRYKVGEWSKFLFVLLGIQAFCAIVDIFFI